MSRADHVLKLAICGLACLLLAASPDVISPASATPAIDAVADTESAAPGKPGNVLLAAGDIGQCDVPGAAGAAATAALIEGFSGPVLALGDEAYESGTAREFADCYDALWGAFKDRTRPVPGNHEYNTPNGTDYFAYFGDAAGEAGRGWYSFDFAGWHVVALNGNCTFVSCASGSEQEQWLREDLATHPATCTLAFWHQPLFGSGPNGGSRATRPFWDALYDAGADVVLNGHNHLYERFAPQDPDGHPDPVNGIREFTVGTGGAVLHQDVRPQRNSEVINTGTWGMLELTLEPDHYEWQFLPAAGSGFSDSGRENCH